MVLPVSQKLKRCWHNVMSGKEAVSTDPPRTLVSPQWTGGTLGMLRSKAKPRAHIRERPQVWRFTEQVTLPRYKSEQGHHHLPRKMPSATARGSFLAGPFAQALLCSGHWTPASAWESPPPLAWSRSSISIPHLYVRLVFIHGLTQQTRSTYNVPGAVLSIGYTARGRTQSYSSSMTLGEGSDNKQAKQL